MTIRVGLGFDVHRLVAGRPLIIGGIPVPSPVGAEGHSDADVLLHALMDACLGAAGLPDIGHFFPPSDPAYKDADSRALLREVMGHLRKAGWKVVNVDAVVILEAPKIGPYVPAMKSEIARLMDIPASAVGMKATTGEGLGYVGRREGIAAQAVALLQRI